jgi:hypothetical protein
MLDKCIDAGFELISTKSTSDEPGGSERVVEALKCRMWTSLTECASITATSETLLDSFEKLMSEMSIARKNASSLPDADRRATAERLAQKFAILMDSDED